MLFAFKPVHLVLRPFRVHFFVYHILSERALRMMLHICLCEVPSLEWHSHDRTTKNHPDKLCCAIHQHDDHNPTRSSARKILQGVSIIGSVAVPARFLCDSGSTCTSPESINTPAQNPCTGPTAKHPSRITTQGHDGQAKSNHRLRAH